MCKACAMRAFGALNPAETETFSHAGAVGTFAAKLTDAFPIDGVGDLKPPVAPELLITTDTVPDAPDTTGSTNPVLTVTAPGTTTPVISTIDTIGDQDFYKVTLTAGTAYEFGLYSHLLGPNLVGLTDPYLELYAADGSTLLVSADGGADTLYNQLNSGFDVLLVYTPTTSGTYYLNARAFSNTPLTSTGDSVGDYQLFAREQDLTDPNIYRPYYEPTDPLYAIDWGTQVGKENTTVRNPDGDEGTRSTGNAQGTPTYSIEVDIAALAAAQGVDITGKNVITIYFARPGDVFVSNDPTNPGLPPATITAVAIQDFERTAVWTSLAEFAKVADVVYLEVDDRDHADFVYTSYTGTPGPGISLLGSMSPPGESDEGLAQFNSGDYRWNATDLQQGGFSFVTLIHEFGHGHGLAHPHDNGGRSGIMNGVEQESPTSVANYTTGDFALNQGVFTMMSYEDGWQSSPYGNAPTDVGYGYLGGLMAFDIAAIQDKYGVNEDWATGNDTYTLKDVNAAGTYFSSIWDGGGTDAIVYSGARDALIDLRAATLAYEVGGGGRVSYAEGIFGGFTIANGVTIENATGGDGDDTLIGNAAANVLDGGDGFDTAIFEGTANAHSWSVEGPATHMGGASGADTLIGIERMEFADAAYELRATGQFGAAALVSGTYGSSASAGGWANNDTFPRLVGDIDGDGRADLVGFGSLGVYTALTSAHGQVGSAALAMGIFGHDAGWSDQDTYPRLLADLNGDGMADLAGFGSAGLHVALATGGGEFAEAFQATPGFGAGPEGGGWTDNGTYPRTFADVNGDGLADVVGIGSGGVHVALGTGGGHFGDAFLAAEGFGAGPEGGGWTDAETYPRLLADVNGDGRSDLVGFGSAGVYVALGTAGGQFGEAVFAAAGFGVGAEGGGWTSDGEFKRMLADINGDGRDDIVGFGAGGTWTALGEADGTFGDAFLALGSFGTDDGWISDDLFHRTLADVDADGALDIVGFGTSGTYVAWGDGAGGFSEAELALDEFGNGAAGGSWAGQATAPRFLADLNGDGAADIVGFGSDGVHTAIVTSEWVLV